MMLSLSCVVVNPEFARRRNYAIFVEIEVFWGSNMRKHRSVWVRALAGIACCAAPLSPPSAGAAEKVIHAFKGGNDGENPYSGLISDGVGNAYGTTDGGGSGGGVGTVFKLTKDRKESALYAFKGGSDGAGPDGALMLDGSGDLYGTTVAGGGTGCDGYGCGTVFKLAPDGKETVLYAFQGGSDGFQPVSNIVMDQSGNLYGTTAAGGAYNSDCSSEGCGTAFELQPNGTKITLYQFQGGTDGEGPTGPLIADSAGNLYGTTEGGDGCALGGCGIVFELTPGGQESILYAFQGGADGLGPFGGVVMDGAGNLYGTTGFGGANTSGVVFEVPAGGGSENVLYSFRGGSDGALPVAGVVRDSNGNLYGTTEIGGGSGKGCKHVQFGAGCGTVFELTPAGKETILYHFYGRRGQLPKAPLLLGKNGALYGTTTEGGAHKDGVVFEVKK
jgi:uncharacterized repeat protein (TIGR03803 family)